MPAPSEMKAIGDPSQPLLVVNSTFSKRLTSFYKILEKYGVLVPSAVTKSINLLGFLRSLPIAITSANNIFLATSFSYFFMVMLSQYQSDPHDDNFNKLISKSQRSDKRRTNIEINLLQCEQDLKELQDIFKSDKLTHEDEVKIKQQISQFLEDSAQEIAVDFKDFGKEGLMRIISTALGLVNGIAAANGFASPFNSRPAMIVLSLFFGPYVAGVQYLNYQESLLHSYSTRLSFHRVESEIEQVARKSKILKKQCNSLSSVLKILINRRQDSPHMRVAAEALSVRDRPVAQNEYELPSSQTTPVDRGTCSLPCFLIGSIEPVLLLSTSFWCVKESNPMRTIGVIFLIVSILLLLRATAKFHQFGNVLSESIEHTKHSVELFSGQLQRKNNLCAELKKMKSISHADSRKIEMSEQKDTVPFETFVWKTIINYMKKGTYDSQNKIMMGRVVAKLPQEAKDLFSTGTSREAMLSTLLKKFKVQQFLEKDILMNLQDSYNHLVIEDVYTNKALIH